MVDLTMYILLAGVGVLGLASIYRAFVGPTATDRIVAMNMIVTTVVVYILVFTYLDQSYFFIDVALLFILAAFITTLCVLKFLREGRLF